ncbi:MAG: DUF3500 domain-containing protein [Sciscionella sp.]
MNTTADAVHHMEMIARRYLAALTTSQRATAAYAFADPLRWQWTYLPRPRPGPALLELGAPARKAAYRLLSTAVSRHTFAQAMAIMALEEVLDLDEDGQRGRRSDNYRVTVFGEPGGDAWSWRFEGHHLSVTATITGHKVVVAPVFLGANPATVSYAGTAVLRPLPLEEDLARAVLSELTAAQRTVAITSTTAPPDILTSTHTTVAEAPPLPVGIRHTDMGPTAQDLLARLIDLYLDRLTPTAAHEARQRRQLEQSTFAWAGAPVPGAGHYYCIHTPTLLIEYDNTQHSANHAHTVLRCPADDFGASLLTEHHAAEHT